MITNSNNNAINSIWGEEGGWLNPRIYEVVIRRFSLIVAESILFR